MSLPRKLNMITKKCDSFGRPLFFWNGTLSGNMLVFAGGLLAKWVTLNTTWVCMRMKRKRESVPFISGWIKMELFFVPWAIPCKQWHGKYSEISAYFNMCICSFVYHVCLIFTYTSMHSFTFGETSKRCYGSFCSSSSENFNILHLSNTDKYYIKYDVGSIHHSHY